MTVRTANTPKAEIPIVPGLPVLGNMRELQRDPFGFTLETIRRYGDVVRFRFLGDESILVSHPDDIQHVLQANNRNYDKQTFDYELLYPLVGQGLLTSDGDFWLRQRRLAAPAFHRQRIIAFADMMVEATLAMLQRWRPLMDRGEAVAIDQEMMRLTLTIVGQALLNIDLGDEASAFGRAFKQANSRFGYHNMLSIMFPWLPTPANLRFKAAIRTMNQIADEIIRERRDSGEDHGDLLSMLMSARDEETGERMSDRQLRDEVLTILLAGHETTANALTWALYLLSQHPDAARELRAQIDRVLGGRPATAGDLPVLSYTRMVFQETLRLYPPAWGIARRAIEDDTLGGYRVPAGSVININIYALHRHPDFWDDPDEFRPERFSELASQERHKFAYLPFSAGPRKCIGDQFAMFEGQLILATIAQHLDLALVPGHPVEKLPLITLNPRYGMKMMGRWRH